ncbi:MAG: hypothetical protein JG782_1427 [Anaerophaga sp.]|nr:hypothetical protein [Anaerophaga sp.]
MYLNREEFINNDGLHSNQTISEPAALRVRKGYYKIKLYFTEDGGGYNLEPKAKLPDGTEKELTPYDFWVGQ